MEGNTMNKKHITVSCIIILCMIQRFINASAILEHAPLNNNIQLINQYKKCIAQSSHILQKTLYSPLFKAIITKNNKKLRHLTKDSIEFFQEIR